MDDEEAQRPDISITIDGLTYRCRPTVVTVNGIRGIAHPPIENGRDIWLAVPNDADRFLADNEEVALTNGLSFFTAPHSILAGRHHSDKCPDRAHPWEGKGK